MEKSLRSLYMKKPILSPNFAIDDIHKIREYNYELTKNMSTEEMCEYINNRAKNVLKEMAEHKAEKAKKASQ